MINETEFNVSLSNFLNHQPTHIGNYITNTIDTLLFILLLVFLIVFIILSNLIGYRWLSSLPQEGFFKNKKPEELSTDELNKITENIKDIFEEWSKEQNFSSILAGFSLSAITFILAFKDLGKVTGTIEFFSFAFIFEMLSFMFYKYMTKQSHEYYGTLLQFTGLLALLDGLLIFIIGEVGITLILSMAYAIGYAGFLILSIKQLAAYFDLMKEF